MLEVRQLIPELQHYGVRRLLVLSGSKSWCYQQALKISVEVEGDWLWVSPRTLDNIHNIVPSKANTLLGQEFKHAVFDAREGFNAEAFAILAGTLAAGSVLILLIPEWDEWQDIPDADSLRWSEAAQAIATPHFVTHMKHLLTADVEALLWREGQCFNGHPLNQRALWQKPSGTATSGQQKILRQVLNAKPGIFVLSAPRGRGKSALAGMLIEQLSRMGQICWLTAPNRIATETVRQFSHDNAIFYAPDVLLEMCHADQLTLTAKWLIIDEAAAIPAAILNQLITFFPSVLLTTTIQGYEGTGRGFLLKFCANLVNWTALSLTQPIRWAENDPLEQIVDNLLLLQTEYDATERLKPVSVTVPVCHLIKLSQQQLTETPQWLNQFYGLLTSAHYRTSPLDLRRLLDAPAQTLAAALDDRNQMIAALWVVNEGGLDRALALDVWAGRRRPPGNLVAQSLAAHAGLWSAPTLSSQRISRIAVKLSHRRQGVAKMLVTEHVGQARQTDVDYLSVSFGYTDELLAFWQSCGFDLVHIGSHKEPSSGCYSAMAILPLTLSGEKLFSQARDNFERNWSWRQSQLGLNLTVVSRLDCDDFTDADWWELMGFAFAYRQPEASYASLGRLLQVIDEGCESLRFYYSGQMTEKDLIDWNKLSGRAQLIKLWRAEVASALIRMDNRRCETDCKLIAANEGDGNR